MEKAPDSTASEAVVDCPLVSSSLRSPFRILGMVGLGALTLLALLATVFWVVFHRPAWIDYLPETDSLFIQRTVERIYRERLRWPAADSNDNGVPDWYEESQGLDPRKGATSVNCTVIGRTGFVFLGERTRIRLSLGAFLSYEDIRWPPNMDLQITAAGPILLAAGSADGTPPTAGPLRVQVTPEGRLEFDVLCLRKQDADGINLTHTRSGHVYNQFMGIVPFRVADWRLPSVPSHVEVRGLDLDRYAWQGPPNIFYGESFGPPAPRPHLVWEPLTDPSTVYILQAARPDAPDEWWGFAQTEPGDPPSTVIGYHDRKAFPRYLGPLLYRVVPVSKEKPPAR